MKVPTFENRKEENRYAIGEKLTSCNKQTARIPPTTRANNHRCAQTGVGVLTGAKLGKSQSRKSLDIGQRGNRLNDHERNMSRA